MRAESRIRILFSMRWRPSVDDVSPELLEAYVEMFQKIEHGKIDSALRQSIHQGLWLPPSATEYMQRFIAFASGTGAPS